VSSHPPDAYLLVLAIHRGNGVGYFGARRTKCSIYRGGDQAKMAQRSVDVFANDSCVRNLDTNRSNYTGGPLGAHRFRSVPYLEVDTGSGKQPPDRVER